MPNDDMSEAASPGNKHYVHEKGICESVNVGHGTRIWAFAHVLPGAQIGENCNICDQVFIENDVIVGDEVTVKRLKTHADHIELLPANPEFAPIRVDANQTFAIEGLAVGLLRGALQ